MNTSDLIRGFTRGGHPTLEGAADAAATPSPEIPHAAFAGGAPAPSLAPIPPRPSMTDLLRAALLGTAAGVSVTTPEERAEREAQKARARAVYREAGLRIPDHLEAANRPDFGGGQRGQMPAAPPPGMNELLRTLYTTRHWE